MECTVVESNYFGHDPIKMPDTNPFVNDVMTTCLRFTAGRKYLGHFLSTFVL